MGTIGGSTAQAAQSAVVAIAAIQNNPSAINNLIAASINANGQTYSISSSSSSSSTASSYYNQASNSTALTIGLVVGLVGGALLLVGSIFGFKKYQKKQRGRRLINDEPDIENSWSNRLVQNNENTTNLSKPTDNDVKRTPGVSDLPNFDPNRFHSPLPNNPNEQRVPSAAMSITALDLTTTTNQQYPSNSMAPIELIKFD
jgi:hypothetical protein